MDDEGYQAVFAERLLYRWQQDCWTQLFAYLAREADDAIYACTQVCISDAACLLDLPEKNLKSGHGCHPQDNGTRES